MFQFQDHERAIYSPPGSGRQYDPLALDRKLTILSHGQLPGWWVEWQTKAGDATIDGNVDESQARVVSAAAEERLSGLARAAFGLPAFPECPDATALEYLVDFLEYLEKKGRRGD